MGSLGLRETPALRVTATLAHLEPEAPQDFRGQMDFQALPAPQGQALWEQWDNKETLGSQDFQDC